MEQLTFLATSEDENCRIDRFLSVKQNSFTRSALEKHFDNKNITVNDTPVLKNYKLKSGDKIEILQPLEKAGFSVKALDLPLKILYEDAVLLVVNKPKGMLVHPSAKGENETLAGALLYHCKGKLSTIGGELRPGIVHRIDKDTSGLLVAAKTNEAHEALSKQVEAHTMLRRYEGVTEGIITDDDGVIDAPIARHPVHRTKNCVPKNPVRSRNAVTQYRVIARYDGFTHAEFYLKTGRMHQIRVHMEHIGHPVAGDTLYGAKPVKAFTGQCLHAGTLGFVHPVSGEALEFHAELPKYFIDFLARISKYS